jgi:NitT/TauT family transport system ATP-binding protein/sulfonate transport system ATP-binding protein
MAIGPEIALDLRRFGFAGGVDLFQDLHLKVAGGEVVALIGPSGVGKTTLLRMVAGVQGGFAGTVLIDGIAAAAAPRPGMVFQDARLLPWLTVAGNIRAVSPEMTDAGIDALLEQVGLGGLAGLWPRQLSGGMQRRLGLARALSVNPRLLLLDEPFVSLDRAVVRDLQALVRQVVEALRPTVLLVSHDAEDAALLADRAVILSGRPARLAGEVALAGPRGAVAVAKAVERIGAVLGQMCEGSHARDFRLDASSTPAPYPDA